MSECMGRSIFAIMKPVLYMFLFLPTGLLAQNVSGQLVVDSGIVYENFYKGGTTAMISYYSLSIDTMAQVDRKPISRAYIDTLSAILSGLKPKRHFQQKIGPGKYAKVYISGIPHRLAFIDNWAIIDFSCRPYKQIVVTKTKYANTFHSFIKNNWP